MRRREFITGLSGLTLLSGLVEAQQRIALVGVLASEPWRPIEGLRDGLERLGYSNRHVSIEYRWFQGQASRLPDLAADLVRIGCDAIVTVGTPAAIAAKNATKSIPIVMGLIGDPVGAGLVTSIARPEGNITGVSVLAAELEPKRLELLKQIRPELAQVIVLGNADNPYSRIALDHARRGATSLGLTLRPVFIRDSGDIDNAFKVEDGATGALIVADQKLLTERGRIAFRAEAAGVISAFTYREHVEAGGLLSYSTDYFGAFRLASTYIDSILKGRTTNELPIQQVTKFELIVNQKTARRLGILIPPTMLGVADEVIE